MSPTLLVTYCPLANPWGLGLCWESPFWDLVSGAFPTLSLAGACGCLPNHQLLTAQVEKDDFYSLRALLGTVPFSLNEG